MKKNRTDKWVAIGLIACLLAGMLTGCGGALKENETAVPEMVATQGETFSGENTAEVPEETTESADPYTGPIYNVEWLTLDWKVESITEALVGGDVLYLHGGTEKDESGESRHVVVSSKLDGTEQKIIWEFKKLEKAPELSEGETYTHSSFLWMDADDEGNLLMLFMEYRYAHGQKMNKVYRLQKLDSAGNECWSVDLPKNINPVEMICAGNHTIITLESVNENNGVLGPTEILVYDKDGMLKVRHNTNLRSILGLCSYVGKAYLYDGPDRTIDSVKLREISFETGEFGDEFGGGLKWYGKWIGSGAGYDLLTVDNAAIWGFDFDENYSVKVLDYQLSGIHPEGSSMMIPMGESDFVMLTGVNSAKRTKPQMALLTRATREEVESKQDVTVAILQSLGGTLPIDFNAQNDRYRVHTVSYSGGAQDGASAEEHRRNRIERLKEDIKAGKAPDVVILGKKDVGLLYEELCQGAFEDLYPWLNSDKEFSADKLFATALRAGELEGKLYSLILSFSVQTIIGKTSIFGPADGITASELLEISKFYPNSKICPDTRGVEAIVDFVENSGKALIDERSGEVRFNSEEFIAMLEIAKQMNELSDVNNKYGTAFKNDEILVQEILIENYTSLSVHDGYYGESVSAIGYAGEDGNGSALTPGACVLMLSQSDCKKGAWAFIRSFLDGEYQNDRTYINFPILLSAMEALEKSQTSSEAEAERTNDIIENAASTLYQNLELRSALIEAVKEAATPYFAGEKNAKEVAEELQLWAESRVSK